MSTKDKLSFEERAYDIINDYNETMRWWGEGDTDQNVVQNNLNRLRKEKSNLVDQANRYGINTPNVTVVRTLVI